MPPPLPCRFGRYVLAAPLGEGANGEVYLAVSNAPGAPKICVIKRLARSHATSAIAEARFRREAAIALRLSHATITQTLSAEEHEGEFFIVQEWVQGVDL